MCLLKGRGRLFMLVINGRQAFCVLAHTLSLSHYFSYCETMAFLEFHKGFFFLLLLFLCSWFWNRFLFVSILNFKRATTAALSCQQLTVTAAADLSYSFFVLPPPTLVRLIYGFVLPMEAKPITTLLVRTNRIFCSDRRPVDRTVRAGGVADADECRIH